MQHHHHPDLTHHRRIAVVGGGVAGLSAAWLLSRKHEVTLYEKEDWLGGHAHTVDVETPGGRLAVDTGFIVYNQDNYPNFTALLQHLQVPSVETHMSFAASVGNGRFEYSSDFRGLIGQKRNLARPGYWQMLTDIVLPAALPSIFAGLRIAVGSAWMLTVTAEMVAVKSGLGYVLWDSYYFLRYDIVIAAMISIGLLGYLSDLGLKAIMARTLRWQQTTTVQGRAG